MRYVRRIATFALLFVVLLTWALVRSFGERTDYGKRSMEILNNLTSAENRLLKDVLLARSALLQTYDPLVSDIDDMHRWSDRLAAEPTPWRAEAQAIRRAVQKKEDALEHFKSEYALLHNSVAYFDVVSTRTADSHEDADFKNEVAGIAGAVMHLLRSPTDSDARALALRLEKLKQPPFAANPDAGLMYQHGMLLVRAIPETNEAIQTLQDQTVQPATKRILATIDQHRAAVEQSRVFGDATLYVSSFVIFLLLIRALFLLHRDSTALHWTALKERLAFEASRLFIACPPELVDRRLADMMKILVEGYGSDRGYLLRLDGSRKITAWSSNPASTNDWPAALFAFVPEIVAQPMEAFRLPYDDVSVSAALRQSLIEAGARVWACVKVRLEGEVVALLCFDRTTDLPTPVTASHGNLSLLANVVSNTFLRQKLYRNRSELEGKLRKAERLEAIGTFTSGVAHNFNNLIGAIAGQAEMAIDTLPTEHVAVAHVRQVLQTSTRAKEVANQILEFGRIGEGVTQNVRVAPIIEETAAYIASTSKEPVDLRMSGGDCDASTRADPGKLQQVFHNVIINAIQAAAGSIDVSIEVCTTNERQLAAGPLRAGRYVRVRIKDQGQGIDAQTQKKIFEPFFTTRPTGTGLGLATVLETLNELDGGVEIDSKVGVGTTFTLWLPDARGQLQSLPPVDPIGRTVLLVNEDRESMLQDEEFLATLGFEPIGFTDAAKALEALQRNDDRFDVLIVDRQIAGMSTQAFVDAARGNFSDGNRIIVTGSCIGVKAGELESLRVRGHVGRPWSPRSLASAINGALAA